MKSSGNPNPIRRPAAWRLLALLACGAVILPVSSCKNFGAPDFRLTVTVGDGVTGTPAAGIYSYKDLTEITYAYTAVETNLPAIVTVNGSEWSSSGTLVMYNDLDVVTYALDIRDAWDIIITPSDADSDDDKIKFKLTFAGTPTGGAFSDANGHGGTWAIVTQTLTLTYSNWETYILTATAKTSMSGTYTNGTASGVWTATRST